MASQEGDDGVVELSSDDSDDEGPSTAPPKQDGKITTYFKVPVRKKGPGRPKGRTTKQHGNKRTDTARSLEDEDDAGDDEASGEPPSTAKPPSKRGRKKTDWADPENTEMLLQAIDGWANKTSPFEPGMSFTKYSLASGVPRVSDTPHT